jgi:hypothetical protein
MSPEYCCGRGCRGPSRRGPQRHVRVIVLENNRECDRRPCGHHQLLVADEIVTGQKVNGSARLGRPGGRNPGYTPPPVAVGGGSSSVAVVSTGGGTTGGGTTGGGTTWRRHHRRRHYRRRHHRQAALPAAAPPAAAQPAAALPRRTNWRKHSRHCTRSWRRTTDTGTPVLA